MLNYKQIWHGIKPIRWLNKFNLTTFIVVRSFSPYIAILGRPWIHAMKAVPSTLHVKVKFPTEYGVVVVRGNQRVARQCLVAAVRWKSEQLGQAEETEKETL